MNRYLKLGLVGGAAAMLMPEVALAVTGGGTGFPWDTPLNNLESNITTVVAPIIVVLAVVIVALTAVFGAGHGFSGRAVGLIGGGSVALGFAAFMTALGWIGAVV